MTHDAVHVPMSPFPSSGFLSSYDPTRYPPVALTVDLVVLTIRVSSAQILLIRRGGPPFHRRWALPGGFVRPDESLDEAASRELFEETAIEVGVAHLEQLATYADPGRDPRMRVATVAYLALVPDPGDATAGSDAAEAAWWPLDRLSDISPSHISHSGTWPSDISSETAEGFAFDHERIITDGIERARAKLEYTTLATRFLPDEFTMTQLRSVYETFWGAKLHASNFARKATMTNGFVIDTRRRSASGAKLWRAGGAELVDPPLLRPVPDDHRSAARA